MTFPLCALTQKEHSFSFFSPSLNWVLIIIIIIIFFFVFLAVVLDVHG